MVRGSSSGAMTENLRRETRIDAKVPVVIHRGRTAVTVETSDISFRGLFVCTASPPPLRSLVRLRISLPQHAFDAHAMVVHVVESGEREAGIGMQFWGLAGPDRNAWDDYVRSVVATKRANLKKLAAEGQTPSGVTELPPVALRHAK
ncbi:hypothetical protein AKJ09_09380 [Labilithrix luteola]|uniref:PilZ domain-containing protein n=2 Tax=Labilithrix luteola TaxID=1391654 RepID=A0A0K1QAN3_9BACT|nr:hypothetical protein AKJ09_09380 [Labilithrix luteola]